MAMPGSSGGTSRPAVIPSPSSVKSNRVRDSSEPSLVWTTTLASHRLSGGNSPPPAAYVPGWAPARSSNVICLSSQAFELELEGAVDGHAR